MYKLIIFNYNMYCNGLFNLAQKLNIMKHTITPLVLNLIISETEGHRSKIAGMIVDFLEMNVGEFGAVEKQMRNHFLSRIHACVKNPMSQNKAVIFALADFYNDSYIEHVYEYVAAA